MIVKLGSRRRRSTLAKLRQLICLSLLGTVGIWWGYKQIQIYLAKPEAIFVLGGHEERERFAAQLARKYPNLPVWVSSGSPSNYVKGIFADAGVESDRLYLDYQAKDTVTNFTTLVDEFKMRGIKSVYLITSDSHMGRARLVGEIVFGSQGIIIKPLAVPSQTEPESMLKSLRDGARALLWLGTGRSGEKLIRKL